MIAAWQVRPPRLVMIAAAVLAVGVAAWYVLGASSSDESAPSRAAFVAAAYDRTLGNPKAPVVAIEYAAPQCPVCAHFNAEGIPSLRAQYIDTGKVFYVFRVFPIGPADVPAESIARCLPADNYFQFIDLLYRNQAKWDPEYGVTDVQGGLVAMARIAGMNEGRTLACIADKDEKQMLLEADGDKFADDPHYKNYPAIPVRLAAVDAGKSIVSHQRIHAPEREPV